MFKVFLKKLIKTQIIEDQYNIKNMAKFLLIKKSKTQ